MGINKLIVFLLLATGLCYSQSAQRISVAIQSPAAAAGYARISPHASIYVCTYNSQLNCSSGNYLSIYSDVGLTSGIAQPLVADSVGGYQYYIQAGTQVVEKVCYTGAQCQSYAVYIGTSNLSISGNGAPTQTCSLPNQGQIYIDNLNGQIYSCNGTIWQIAATTAVPASPSFAIQFANSGATHFQADSSITVNPTTHTFTAPNVSASTVVAGAISPGFTVSIKDPRCGGAVDGVTDDAAAWTACIALASANSGTVTTDGLSLLESTPTIPSTGNFKIEGTTPGAGMLFSNPSGWARTVVLPWLYGSTINAGIYVPSGASNITIEDMALTCAPSSATGCGTPIFLLDDNNITLRNNTYGAGIWSNYGNGIEFFGGHDLTFDGGTIFGYNSAGIRGNYSSGLSGTSLRVHARNLNIQGANPSSIYTPGSLEFFNSQSSDFTNNNIDQGNVLKPVSNPCCGYGGLFYTTANHHIPITSLSGMGHSMTATVPGSSPIPITSMTTSGTTTTITVGSTLFPSVLVPAQTVLCGNYGVVGGTGTLPANGYCTIIGTNQVMFPTPSYDATGANLTNAVFWLYGFLPDIGQQFYVDLAGVFRGNASISSLTYTASYLTGTLSTGHYSVQDIGTYYACTIGGITAPTLPSITANVAGGAITSYTVVSGGANATQDYSFTITDSTGTGATTGAQTFNSSGALTALAAGTATGSGYTSPTVTVSGGDGLSGNYSCTVASAAPDTFTTQLPGLHSVIPAAAVATATVSRQLGVSTMATVTGYGSFTFGLAGGDTTGVNLSNSILSMTGTTTITVTVGAGILPPVGSTFVANIIGVTGGTGTLNGYFFYSTVASPTTFTFQQSKASAVGANVSSAYLVAQAGVVSAFDTSSGNKYSNTGGTGIYFADCNLCSSEGDHFFNIDQQELDTSLPVGAVAMNGVIGGVIDGDVVNGSATNCFEAEITFGLVISGSSCKDATESGIKLAGVFNYSIGDYTQTGTSRFGVNINGVSTGATGTLNISGTTSVAINPYGSASSNLIFGGPTKILASQGFCLEDNTTASSYTGLDCNGVPLIVSGTNQSFDNLSVENIPASSPAITLLNSTNASFTNLIASNLSNLFYTSGFNSNPNINGGQVSNVADPYLEAYPAYVTGSVATGSNVIQSISSTLGVGDIVSDATVFGGSGHIPIGSVVLSVNSGTGCTSACVVISNTATGTVSGDILYVFGSVTTGMKWYNVTATGGAGAGQGFLAYSIQGLDMQGGSFSGYSGSVIDLRGTSGTSTPNSVKGVTIAGGSRSLGVSQQASNTTATANSFSGATSAGISDLTSNLGNSYLGNFLSGITAPTAISNVNAVVTGNVAGIGTGTPTSASIPCNANSVSNLYYQASTASGRQPWMCDPVTVTWVQVPAPSAVQFNTVKTVASVPLTTYSGTAGIGTTTLRTPSATGLFQLCVYMEVDTVGTAGNFQFGVGYTSAFGSAAYNSNIGTSVAVSTPHATTFPGSACSTFGAKAGTNIVYQITATSVTGTPTIEYGATLTQLQ